MKKSISAVIAASMTLSVCMGLPQETFNGFLSPLTVYADDSHILNSGKCGESLTWTLSSYGQLTISGTGNMYDYSCNSLPEWYNNRQEITSVAVNSGVASIGEYAFYKCHALTSVSLPNTITSVEKYAFSYCTSLKNLTIPDSVTFIGEKAIASCGLLTDVNMSDNVTYIGDSAFIDCVNLKYINIPNCVSFIGDNAFRFCENLTSVNIPNNLTSLGVGIFSGCKKLSSVTIPNGVTGIGNFAFYECKMITEITIPDSVSTMGYSVFFKCSGLTKVTIPASITCIDSSTFRECDNITDVYYLGSREQWESISIVNYGNSSILNANIHFAVESSDYTVNFDTTGGYCSISSLRTSNGRLANLPTATRNGYIFDGWYTSASGGSKITTSTAFTSNTTIYAHWVNDEYTVTFNANGGNCSAFSKQTSEHKLTNLPTATRSGYIFDGWYTSAIGGTKITTLTTFTSNTTIYAHWVNNEYTVTFNANGGNCFTLSTQTSGHKLTYLPTATRSGYIFDGWYTSASGGMKITTSTTFTSNTTVYAHWTKPESNIAFYSKTASSGTKTTNIQKNGYKGSNWSSPMNSYLYENNGYLYRVECADTEVILEKYDSSFNFMEKNTIEKELAIFGGFYAGNNYNFILFGQNNFDEKDNREIIRVVKYTKDMKRVGSKSFYGCNTYIPFDAGCPRMDEYNGVLYIHTSHEMYKSSDGRHHQSNMDFYINISDMKEIYSRYNVSNTGTGYMSHSFNQFIKVNENGIYTVDHGDAYNRAITAFRRKNINDRNADCRNVFNIMGETGNNVTGVCVGGMELSEDNMLIVGTSVPQDSSWGKTKQKNVFVIRKSLSENDSPTVTYLTNYSESDNVTLSEPKLVKINNDKFMIIWSETVSSQTKLYASLLDGNGKMVGKTFSCDGTVSDCQPIIYNGKVTFYVTNNSTPTFYYSS